VARVEITVPAQRGWLPIPIREAWGFLRRNQLTLLITALLLWIVGGPLFLLVSLSLRRGSPTSPGDFTLANYQTVYLNSLTYPALVNTATYAGVVSVLGLALATLLAWLIERTDMPGRNWAWTMMLLPLAMPGLLASMAWILLLSPKIGLFNLPLRALLDVLGLQLETGPLNIFTLPGMIFVETVRGSTTLFLMMVGAFRLMDPALEEAAVISGAGTFRTFRKVTLGLMLPAILAAGCSTSSGYPRNCGYSPTSFIN
jgi:iron(III) transport system permease protein